MDERARGTWPGVLDAGVLKPQVVQASHRLADAAKVGDWYGTLAALESSHWLEANCWRITGRSWFTPLHQVAWHGAPVEIAERLLERGAWRGLRTADGRRAVDIARERGHAHLVGPLDSPGLTADQLARQAAWDRRLVDLIAERTRSLPPVRYRPVPSELIAVEGLESLWFAYPGMHGGFSVAVEPDLMRVRSWCRVVGGSGQEHEITVDGIELADEGFV